MMVVFTIFFSRVANVSSGDYPYYPLFAFAGLLPWTFFATSISTAGNSVVVSERLITKVYFPRLAIPFAAVGATAVDFVIAFGMLLVLMLWYQTPPGLGMLAAPVIFAVIVFAAVGVGTLLAALNVAYRDFRYVIPFLVQLWMFATPTVYMQPDPNKTDLLHLLLALNPMTALIANFRAACLGGPIDWAAVGLSAAFVAVVFLAGCFYFRRVEDSFADII
jgi:lipopolysaccharide transport system permease protein